MKRLFVLLLTVMLAAFMVTACGQSGGSGEDASSDSAADSSSAAADFDPSSVKTMGDFIAYAVDDNYQEAYTETQYVFAFDFGGTYYRAVADLPEDVSKALWEIEFDDADKDQKVRDLVAPLELASLENLSEGIPSQEELDKLVGKKGQELFDDGWSYNYYNLEEMEAGLDKGPYSYVVAFDYDGEQMENTDDFDFYEEFKDLTVKSITCEGVGNASYTE